MSGLSGMDCSFRCVHLATPRSSPCGYQKLVPAQSGHARRSSSLSVVCVPSAASEVAISVACCLSTFQSLRRRCSVRNAGTFETVVRPAAILSSIESNSNKGSQACAEDVLPVSSLSTPRSDLAKASSSEIFSIVLKEVLGASKVVVFSTDKPLSPLSDSDPCTMCRSCTVTPLSPLSPLSPLLPFCKPISSGKRTV